jgi:hypothetical protein
LKESKTRRVELVYPYDFPILPKWDLEIKINRARH